MPTDSLLSTLHLALLAAFVGIAAVSALVALVNGLRIPKALLTWRRGGWIGRGVPVVPLGFTAAVAVGGAWAQARGHAIHPGALVGYPVGGLFWSLAAYLSRSVVVTEYGLVPDINRISRAVAWTQIEDYFTTSTARGPRFVFFYTELEDAADESRWTAGRGGAGNGTARRSQRRDQTPPAGTRRRLEVTVPPAQADAFRRVVRAKLDARFRVRTDRTEDQPLHGS
jgi:hypothetical protein